MPWKPKSPCLVSGCPLPAVRSGRCLEHARQFDRERARPTRQAQGYTYAHEKAAKKFLAENPYCCQCGRPSQIAHHIVPKAEGGPDDAGNFSPMCRSCHSKLSIKLGQGWGKRTAAARPGARG